MTDEIWMRGDLEYHVGAESFTVDPKAFVVGQNMVTRQIIKEGSYEVKNTAIVSTDHGQIEYFLIRQNGEITDVELVRRPACIDRIEPLDIQATTFDDGE